MKNKTIKISIIVITTIFIINGFNPLISINAENIKFNKENNNVNTFEDIVEDLSLNSPLNNYEDKSWNDEIKYIPGEIIVKIKKDVLINSAQIDDFYSFGIPSIDKINKKFRVKSVKSLSYEKTNSFLSSVYKIILPEEIFVPYALIEYNKNPNVEYAEPNYIYQTCQTPNDPLYNMQWALNQTSDCDIDAPEAWDTETGNPDVVIAVIDTGVDYNHPDLSENIWTNNDEIPNNGIDDDNNGYIDDTKGWDFANNDNDPIDDNSHGTHCSGIISAVGNNNIGITGICWNCKIMPIKFLGSHGGGSLEDGANAIIYAADNGVDIISMSWGGLGESQILKDALDYAYSKNVVLVAAAGNNNLDLDHTPYHFTPAGYKNVISVAATDENDEIAGFSNYGRQIDIAAPGVNILSTIPTYITNYSNKSGTSMACPYAAGLAGLILSINPNLNPSMVKTIIQSSTDELNPSDKFIGFGRINAFTSINKTANSIANINCPSPNEEVNGLIEINGTATGEKFQDYIVEYRKSSSPDDWTLIFSSDESVDEDILAFWDTTKLDEYCLYTIRLTVINNNLSYEDRTWVIVNNYYNVIYVDDDNINGPWDGKPEHPYQYIKEAVNNAGKGDTVYVFSGSYSEDIIINTPIELFGEDKYNTKICAEKLCCISIFAEKVTVHGFNLIAKGHSLFIYSSNNTIEDNIIEPFLPHMGFGIIIEPPIFIISYCSCGTITAITPNIQNNIIRNNKIIKNSVGITLKEASKNSIYHNDFIENQENIVFSFNSVFILDFVNKNIYNYKPPSTNNNFYENYWDDWLGVKYKSLRCFPKLIQGQLLIRRWFLISSKITITKERIARRYCFDRNPLTESYTGGAK